VRDELGEAAGLEARRHQQEVGAGVDRADEILVERMPAHPARVALDRRLDLLLVLSGAHDDDLGAARDHLVDRGDDEVDALLVREARGHGEERGLWLDGEPEPPLQERLVQGLAFGDVLRTVARVSDRILARVVHLLIDAVQDARDAVGPRAQDALQTHAELGPALDLARVGRAHGRHRVGQNEPGFQVAHGAPVLERAHRLEVLLVKAGLERRVRRVDALEGEVVDRDDRARRGEERVAGVGDLQVGGDQRRVPVVGVRDVGLEVQRARRLESRARVEGEALVVDVEAVGGVSVERVPVAAVIVGVLEKDHVHAVDALGPQPRALLTRADRDGDPLVRAHEVLRELELAVFRQDERDVVAARGEPARDRVDDVGQAAGLDERDRLGADHEHVERASAVEGGRGPRRGVGSVAGRSGGNQRRRGF